MKIDLSRLLQTYLEQFPEEHVEVQLLADQIDNNEPLNDRKNFRGHIAVDGMVVSPDRKKLLLVHHNIFGFWLQPGGHWDSEDVSLRDGAAREVKEETNLEKFEFIEWLSGLPDVPLDIDTHPIPERPEKSEEAHFHHSFAYVFQAHTTELTPQLEEVSGAKWFTIAEVEKMHRWHFPRVIKKLRHLKLIT